MGTKFRRLTLENVEVSVEELGNNHADVVNESVVMEINVVREAEDAVEFEDELKVGVLFTKAFVGT